MDMMPLGIVESGDSVVIGKITGQDEVRQHLAELGFVVGERVTVVNKMGGNLICAVKDSRIALSQSMAMRVMVS
jgi:ferrous iron transport protein A